MQLSKTVMPGFVYVRMRYSSKGTGFCVGCTGFGSLWNLSICFGYPVYFWIYSFLWQGRAKRCPALSAEQRFSPFTFLLHSLRPCGLYIIRTFDLFAQVPAEKTEIISWSFIGLFFAFMKPKTRVFSHIQSYLNSLKLLILSFVENGSAPKMTAAPFGFKIRLYAIHMVSKGIIESHLQAVVP